MWCRTLGAITASRARCRAAVLAKSAELGLVSITVPEAYGGMELDLSSALVVAEHVARDGSYAAWHGAHAGIGTLPLVYFGTGGQKKKYLPKLATAEMIGAYCLTEPHAGSDALAARTRADLNAEGTHYILNGQKMWITNGGAADLFTVFAKIGGEQFTAFLVERGFGGVSQRRRRKEDGDQGQFHYGGVLRQYAAGARRECAGRDRARHIIAFNVLNLGRLKLGPFAVGGAKQVLAEVSQVRERAQGFRKCDRASSGRSSTSLRRWPSASTLRNRLCGARRD